MKSLKTHLWVCRSSKILKLVLLLLLLVGCKQSKESASPEGVEPVDEIISVGERTKTAKEAPAENNKQNESDSTPNSKQVAIEFSAFLDAALDGDMNTVRQAIEGGMDVNKSDDQQRTALMLAAFNGHTPIVKLLLDEDADLGHRDAMGRTPLMFAATADNGETVRLLIDAGAEVNRADTNEGFTALMHAAAEGQLKVVQILLKHRADPAIQDVDGDTAFDFATRNGHTEIVKELSQ